MYYRVGGSLNYDTPSYVERQADTELYQALEAGEFCYILNSRQMGKSSLLVRILHRFRQQGYVCATLDMTNVGSNNIEPQQWYGGIIGTLFLELGLTEKLNLVAWLKEYQTLAPLQKLNQLIVEVLKQVDSQEILIFVDEIDSVLNLDFNSDDFFAFIRYCYNQRAIDPSYNRLRFALFGVATPSDLIADKKRTPFNIGRAIALPGFTLAEAQPLIAGLEPHVPQPQIMLQEVLKWTSGQPFLTQKLCQLILELKQSSEQDLHKIPAGIEAFWIESLVQSKIIHHWQSQDEPEHLRTIRDRLLYSPENVSRILGLYQRIRSGEIIESDDSYEQSELILSGLVEKYRNHLRIKNRIYKEVFNLDWVQQQLQAIRPYSQAFEAWVASDCRDRSRLLRGQALKDAQQWSQGKSLSDRDYQYIAASQELEREEMQIQLEATRSRLTRYLLGVVSIAFLIATGLGITAFWQYRQVIQKEKEARISEINALVAASEGAYNSNQKLEALTNAITAQKRLQSLKNVNPEIQTGVKNSLEKAVLGVQEFNQIIGHEGAILEADFSPDNQLIVTGGTDKTVRIWQKDGTLLNTLSHDATVYTVQFSPVDNLIVAASLDGIIKIWQPDGTLVKEIQAHPGPIWSVKFSPDGQTFVSGSGDRTVKIWQLDGSLIATLPEHETTVWSVTYSPNNQLIASADLNGNIKLWNRQGELIQELSYRQSDRRVAIWDLAFSRDNKTLAAASADRTIQLWDLETAEMKVLEGHRNSVQNVVFSPTDPWLISVSTDETIKVWSLTGELLQTLRGHTGFLTEVDISSDGKTIASVGSTHVRLWRLEKPLLNLWTAHNSNIWPIAFSPTGESFASGSDRLKIWRSDGTLIKDLPGHDPASIGGLDWSSDNQWLASGADDGTINLWRSDGTLVKTLQAHDSLITDVHFSPDNRQFVSASDDTTLKLWTIEGELLHTLNGSNSRIWSVAFSPDGTWLASVAEEGTLAIWGTDGKLRQAIAAHDNSTWGVAVSRDNIIATASRGGTVKLWTPEGELIRTLEASQHGFNNVIFSPDGQKIAASGSDSTVQLWHIDGTPLKTLRRHTGSPTGLAFHPDGNLLVTGGEDRHLIVWDLDTILATDFLEYGCNWIRDYLATHPQVENRNLCDDPN